VTSTSVNHRKARKSAHELLTRARVLHSTIAQARPNDPAHFKVAREQIYHLQKCLKSLRTPVNRLASKPRWFYDYLSWWMFILGAIAGALVTYACLE
jgi:hypothetical protein